LSGHLIFAAASNTTDVVIDTDGHFAPVSGSTRRNKTRSGRATGHVHGSSKGGLLMRGKRISIGLRSALAIFTLTLLVTSTQAASQERVLHSFGNGADGALPFAALTIDAAGNLYSTTAGGGTYNGGTVYGLTRVAARGWTEKVLYSFCPQSYCPDGASPLAGLILDAAGNLYGTTWLGGAYGLGTVFELTPTAGGGWTETVLYSFGANGPFDAAFPYAGLIFDAAGNLYGTTYQGGNFSAYCSDYGCGTVFELTPNGSGGWTETVLYSFCSQTNCTDGASPPASLIFDAAGNLYGTTYAGGVYNLCYQNTGCGTVFEMTPTAAGGWTERVLHSFGSGTDGAGPYAGVISDAVGNLYGTTVEGGTYNYGTVFEMTPTPGGGWTEKALHSFNNNGTDGLNAFTGLILKAGSHLYGTTKYGGTYDDGTAFELKPSPNAAGGGWSEQVLHSFGSGTDGVNPWSSLIFDSAGNLYGTTELGGTYYNCNGGTLTCGTVFEITP
jgi:uncharacterized repeat protein (TIGR03803 family)